MVIYYLFPEGRTFPFAYAPVVVAAVFVPYFHWLIVRLESKYHSRVLAVFYIVIHIPFSFFVLFASTLIIGGDTAL